MHTLFLHSLQANLFKTERDKVTRALVKEVGDESPLSKLIEAGSDWRGRAQQISLLKAKVNNLQQAQVLLVQVVLFSASLANCRSTADLKHVLRKLMPRRFTTHVEFLGCTLSTKTSLLLVDV